MRATRTHRLCLCCNSATHSAERCSFSFFFFAARRLHNASLLRRQANALPRSARLLRLPSQCERSLRRCAPCRLARPLFARCAACAPAHCLALAFRNLSLYSSYRRREFVAAALCCCSTRFASNERRWSKRTRKRLCRWTRAACFPPTRAKGRPIASRERTDRAPSSHFCNCLVPSRARFSAPGRLFQGANSLTSFAEQRASRRSSSARCSATRRASKEALAVRDARRRRRSEAPASALLKH